MTLCLEELKERWGARGGPTACVLASPPACLLARSLACSRGDEILLTGAAAAIRWGGGGGEWGGGVVEVAFSMTQK